MGLLVRESLGYLGYTGAAGKLVTRGPDMLRASLRSTAPSTTQQLAQQMQVDVDFSVSAAGEDSVYLHGTAGCTGGYLAPPCCPDGVGKDTWPATISGEAEFGSRMSLGLTQVAINQ